MAMKPTPADIAKRKKIMEQRLKAEDPALTKKPSISSLIEKPKSKAKPTLKPIAPKTKPATPKPKASKTLTGPEAIKAIQKRTSPKGVKEYEKGAKKALEKKYPGLYKKSK
jgi:hypothetical protein